MKSNLKASLLGGAASSGRKRRTRVFLLGTTTILALVMFRKFFALPEQLILRETSLQLDKWKKLQVVAATHPTSSTTSSGGSSDNSPLSDEEFQLLLQDHPGIFGFGQEGREMMDSYIQELANKQSDVLLMEVGVWFGQSVARWLNLSQSLKVVGVDPFRAPHKKHKSVQDIPDSLKNKFGTPRFNKAVAERYIASHSMMGTQRSALIEGYYPQAIDFWLEKRDRYPSLDIFYLDGGKAEDKEKHLKFVSDSLNLIAREFPNAALAGDDWSHGTHAYEFQSLIIDLAKRLGRGVYVSGNRTWIIPSPKIEKMTCSTELGRNELTSAHEEEAQVVCTLVNTPTSAKKKKATE